MADFHHQPLFELGHDPTDYRLLTTDGVSTTTVGDRTFLQIEAKVLTSLAEEAMHDVSYLLRASHLESLSRILDDPEASENDRFVALELLKNASVSAGGILPMCQDTGTAIVIGHKGQHVLTDGDDVESLSRGIFQTFHGDSLRYSQMAPLTMYEERNTGTNLPAQIELYADQGDEYELVFLAKGGGSANKSFLFQQTRAVLDPESLLEFVDETMRSLGTAACPPYHLAVVIGGTSAEFTLKTVKLASAKELDRLPTAGNEYGRAFRDLALEEEILELSRHNGIGAQFGGKYFCHDVRVVRLPRHGASLPIGIGVSCSADRQIKAKINADGVWLEQLETDPARFLPDVGDVELPGEVIEIDLNRPMDEIRAELTKHPIRTRLSLNGPMVVARDIAHAKIKERVEAGEPMPEYLQEYPVYYAGPAKTPEGLASGSFGPTTAGRMDSYVEEFQEAGGSLVMLAKGNRSKQVVDACQRHGGFYLGSIGGPGAILAQDSIRSVEVLEYPELGMEAVWKIEVEGFPAFIVVDDKGNDFFADIEWGTSVELRP